MASSDNPAARLAAMVTELSNQHPMIAAGRIPAALKVLTEYLGDQQRRLVDAETRLAVLERHVRRGPAA